MTALLAGIWLTSELLYWLVMALGAWRVRSVPTLEKAPSEFTDWPGLTVIVPACNEAAEIEPAMRTLLAQDYPALQILLVDDRSTDDTGKIIDALAAADPRVQAIHITALPDGWLGKVHALHTGLAQAKGELVLFTDADVHFAPAALRAAVHYVQRHRLDQLAGFPRLNPSGMILDAMLTAFLRQFVTVMRPWKVSDPRSRAFIGIGAFNLVRRAAFEAAGGFSWLRMEIADDVAVGLMLKRAGYRCAAAKMTEQLSLYWHRTVAQAVRGAEKGWSSVCRFSVRLTVLLGLVSVAMELSPLGAVLIVFPSLRWVGGVGTAAALLYGISSWLISRWMHCRIAPLLASIFVAPIGFAVMLRTAVLGYCRGGAMWRGTFYSNDALQKGKRLTFP